LTIRKLEWRWRRWLSWWWWIWWTFM